AAGVAGVDALRCGGCRRGSLRGSAQFQCGRQAHEGEQSPDGERRSAAVVEREEEAERERVVLAIRAIGLEESRSGRQLALLMTPPCDGEDACAHRDEEQRAERSHHASFAAPVSLRSTTSDTIAATETAPASSVSKGQRLCDVGSIATPTAMRSTTKAIMIPGTAAAMRQPPRHRRYAMTGATKPSTGAIGSASIRPAKSSMSIAPIGALGAAWNCASIKARARSSSSGTHVGGVSVPEAP